MTETDTMARGALTSLLLLLLAVMPGQASKWWMKQPYGGDGFNLAVEYGQELNVTCEDPRLDAEDYREVLYWVLPDLTIMEAGDRKSFKTLDGQAGWEVSDDSSTLRLFIVTENHFGFYHCLVRTNSTENEHVMVKRAVNYNGPYFADLWGEYSDNVLVGCISAAVFLVTVSGTYGGYLFFEHKREKTVAPELHEIEAEEEKAENGMVGNGVYENGAFEVGGDDDASETKM